jgi:hypothetical protein
MHRDHRLGYPVRREVGMQALILFPRNIDGIRVNPERENSE